MHVTAASAIACVRDARRSVLIALVALISLAFPMVARAADPATEDGYIPLSDGTRLRYHVELPAGPGPFPVLMQYDGYSAGTKPSVGSIPELRERLLPRGYAFLGVSIRGTGCSSGSWDVFEPRQAEDGAEAVEWAARQPWSNGRIGMVGYSYPAMMQLLTAAERPPHLRAIAPSSVAFDLYRDVAYPGGIHNLGFGVLFTEQQRLPGQTATPPAVADGDVECLGNYANGQASSEILVLQGASAPYSDSAWPDSSYGWAARSPGAVADRIEVPALTVDYWQDEQTGSRLGGLLERGGLLRSLDPRRTWAVLANGEHTFTESNELYLRRLVRFYEHYVGGEANGWKRTPHVTLMHEVGKSEGEPSWTTNYRRLPAVRPVSLYARRGGALKIKPPRLGESVDSYDYPLPSPSANVGGAALGEVPSVTWDTPTPAAGRVVYTTPKLSRDVELLGSASLDLWLSSTAADTDLQATITEVRPDGQEVYIQRGWLRASHRRLDPGSSTPTRPFHTHRKADVAPLEPGEATLVRLEVFPFNHTFRKGSALRVIVDAPTAITGDWYLQFFAQPAVNRILHDAEHPSRLVVGVVPGGTAPEPSAPCEELRMQPCRASIAPVPRGKLAIADGSPD